MLLPIICILFLKTSNDFYCTPCTKTVDGKNYYTQQMNNFVQILCCVCGIPIAPNSVNTCATCLASASDITHGISTEVTLHQCRSCQRWHKEGGKWLACELESRELMALCLAKTSGIKSTKGTGHTIRLIDAVRFLLLFCGGGGGGNGYHY